jgi:PIN like domain
MAAKKKKSTTRSDTNLESLDLYTFFLDRAAESKDLQAALKAKGAHVEVHRDYYKPDEDDQIWLPEVAAKGWVIISQNQFNEIEREAIRNAGGRAFLIVHAEMKGKEEAEMVAAALPKMLRLLKANSPPFIARLYNPKKILLTSTEFRAHSKLSR